MKRLIARNTSNNAVVADHVGVAASHAARAVGLLAKSGLEQGEALWIVPSRGVHTWGMRFPIDVLALDERGIVIDRVRRMGPWRIRLPKRGTAGVLELAAGAVDQSQTELGHRILFEVVETAGEERRDRGSRLHAPSSALGSGSAFGVETGTGSVPNRLSNQHGTWPSEPGLEPVARNPERPLARPDAVAVEEAR